MANGNGGQYGDFGAGGYGGYGQKSASGNPGAMGGNMGVRSPFDQAFGTRMGVQGGNMGLPMQTGGGDPMFNNAQSFTPQTGGGDPNLGSGQPPYTGNPFVPQPYQEGGPSSMVYRNPNPSNIDYNPQPVPPGTGGLDPRQTPPGTGGLDPNLNPTTQPVGMPDWMRNGQGFGQFRPPFNRG